MLTIRKKGNKNFWHYDTDFTEPYSASDLTIIFDGNTAKLRSVNGRIVFEKDGYLFSDVTIYDDSTGGGAETFATVILLEQRLIELGYNAFYADSTGVADWGNIGGVLGNQTDLIDYINTRTIDGGNA